MSFEVSLLRRNSFSWLALPLALLVWSQAHHSSSSPPLWCWTHYGQEKKIQIHQHQHPSCSAQPAGPAVPDRAQHLPLVPFVMLCIHPTQKCLHGHCRLWGEGDPPHHPAGLSEIRAKGAK